MFLVAIFTTTRPPFGGGRAGRSRDDSRLDSWYFFERPGDRPGNGEHPHLREGRGHRLQRAFRGGGPEGGRGAGWPPGAGRRRRGEEDGGPHARKHRRHPAAQGRRHRRLRDHRGDAPLLHPEDPQPEDPGAAPDHHLRTVRHHGGREASHARVRRSRRRARGLPPRGADSGGEPPGASHHRADALNGGRHRLRHHRPRRDLRLGHLDTLLREETGLPGVLADDPLTAVVMGAGKVLDELSLLKDVAINYPRAPDARGTQESNRPPPWAEAERESARASRRGLGASEERSARRARAPDGPPVTLDYIRRNGVLLTVALCLVVGAALVVRSGRTPGRADPLGRAFLEVMAPLERAASAIGRGLSGSWQGVADLVHARGENAVLRERVQRLEQELDRLSEVEPENARLRQLLDFRQTLQGELLTARVIGRDATGLARTLTID